MRLGDLEPWLKLVGIWNRMAQGQFWEETKSALQTILEIVTSHYQETKLSNQHRENYSQQAVGNNEEGNVPDDVDQSKEEPEETNLKETSTLDQRRVLREDKGTKTVKLTKKTLENSSKIDQVLKELVDINQMHKIVSEGMKDGIMLRDTRTQNENREMREGIT